jgi:hypothetical protein
MEDFQMKKSDLKDGTKVLNTDATIGGTIGGTVGGTVGSLNPPGPFDLAKGFEVDSTKDKAK